MRLTLLLTDIERIVLPGWSVVLGMVPVVTPGMIAEVVNAMMTMAPVIAMTGGLVGMMDLLLKPGEVVVVPPERKIAGVAAGVMTAGKKDVTMTAGAGKDPREKSVEVPHQEKEAAPGGIVGLPETSLDGKNVLSEMSLPGVMIVMIGVVVAHLPEMTTAASGDDQEMTAPETEETALLLPGEREGDGETERPLHPEREAAGGIANPETHPLVKIYVKSVLQGKTGVPHHRAKSGAVERKAAEEAAGGEEEVGLEMVLLALS